MEKSPRKPRYQEVADYLREGILNGTFPAGQALPSEEILSKEFGVSRPTVRQGIAELRAAGLVEVLMGRGMFVRSPNARPNITRPRGIRKDREGRYVEADAIQWTSNDEPIATRTDAPLALADLLRIPPGEPMFTYDELQTAERGRLRQSHRTYVPFSPLIGTPFEETAPPPAPALYVELERLGHVLHWTESVRARMPLPDEATALRLVDGVPFFQVLRLTLNQHDKPLALEEFKIPSDDLEITYGFGTV
ncbi:GntR family transcriptional regulator [Embleya sp. NPDC005575]|uniref:GntR family transcriptional regulator n=1 Tax=Embleya sp. NPDC005575 TaxID=3156892 RepID=UPI0033BA764C